MFLVKSLVKDLLVTPAHLPIVLQASPETNSMLRKICTGQNYPFYKNVTLSLNELLHL